MAIYQQLLNRIILPISDLVLSANYLNYLKLWSKYDSYSEEALRDEVNSKLHDILEYTVNNVPFYGDIHFNSSDSPENNLANFPILSKEVLREYNSELVSREYSIHNLIKNHSSGSSGFQSFTYCSKDHIYYLRALQTHWWKWSGYQIGDKIVQFGISKKRGVLKSFKDLFFRTFYYKAFGLNHDELTSINSLIFKKRLKYIAGYPSVINQLSLISTKKTEVKGIICFGDKFFDHNKKNIQSSFGNKVKIIETYGCAEGLLMACKKDIDHYYIMSPHVFLEIVDDNNNPVKDGEMGHILVTCLTNKAMPLIRYKLGDLGIMLPKKDYPKDALYNYPLLQKVIGRETDVIKTESGKILNVHSFTGVMEYYQEIAQYKIIQRNLSSITVQLKSENEVSSETIQKIKNELLHLTQSELEINFEQVDELSPTASGKPQIIETFL